MNILDQIAASGFRTVDLVIVLVYLALLIFLGNTGTEIAPTPEDIAGFDTWIQNYTACLPIEEAAVQHKA